MAELLTSAREALAESPKHQAIVEAATELFLEAGYGAVSMDAIAARAGVSKRTVYSHFPGKDVLFGAVMGNVCIGVVGMQAPAKLTSGPLRQVLTDYGRTFLMLITSPQALAIFRVNTRLNPESANTYDSLAETLWAVGEKEAALEAYRTVLEKLPDDDPASPRTQTVLPQLAQSTPHYAHAAH